MKKIWIVTEFFAPEETATAHILTTIANNICDNYEVNVICGPSYYEKSASIKDDSLVGVDKRINIFRVSNINLDKNKFITRILRFIILTWKLVVCLYRKVDKNDTVFIVTNPAPLVIFVSLIKKIKGFPLYVLVHDVFPENTIPAGLFKSSKNIIYNVLRNIFNWAYKEADKLVVLGRDMKCLMSEKIGVKSNLKIIIIENWADNDIVAVFKNNNDKIDIQYAGNIGRVQGLMEFVDIFGTIKNDNLHLSFWGKGALEKKLKSFVEEKSLLNVTFHGQYARIEQSRILNSTDIALISLADGMFGLGVPSKTYNILASGNPILFIGDLNSEVALLVKENQIGFCFDSKDKEGIKNFLESLNVKRKGDLLEMGKRAKALADLRYSEKIIMDKYKILFD